MTQPEVPIEIQAEQTEKVFEITAREDFAGPQPWCRVCHKPIALWAQRRRNPKVIDVAVHCHGEEMTCATPDPLPAGCVLEAFCYDDPHVADGYWWLVRSNGTTVQESRRYILSNTGPSFFQSKAAGVVRNKSLVGAIAIVLALIPFLLRYVH